MEVRVVFKNTGWLVTWCSKTPVGWLLAQSLRRNYLELKSARQILHRDVLILIAVIVWAVHRATKGDFFEQALARFRRQEISDVWSVVIQKSALVADRPPVLDRRANGLFDILPFGRNRNVYLCPRFDRRVARYQIS